MLSRKCHFCYENSSFPASRRLIHKKRSKIINNFSKSEIIFYVTQHIFIFLHYYAQNLSIHNAFSFFIKSALINATRVKSDSRPSSVTA